MIIIMFYLKEISNGAPVRKMHLEFQLEETNFFKSVDDAKTVLDQNKQKLANNDNVKDALQKHKVGSFLIKISFFFLLNLWI